MFSGFVLLHVDRQRLPRGALSLLITGHAAFGVTQRFDAWLGFPAAIGGLLAEWIVWLVGLDGIRWRVISAAVPLAVTALHFIGLGVVREVVWSTHLSAGTVVTAGLVGLLVGALIRPPSLVD